MCYMQIFNFRDSHVTTFRHPSRAYIYQMPGHGLSRLAKGTPSDSRLSIGTIGLGSNCFLCRLYAGQSKVPEKREKCCFLDLALPTLQNSGIFHDSTCPHLHFDGLPPKSRRSVVSIYDLRCVTSITKKTVVLVWPGAAHAPIAV